MPLSSLINFFKISHNPLKMLASTLVNFASYFRRKTPIKTRSTAVDRPRKTRGSESRTAIYQKGPNGLLPALIKLILHSCICALVLYCRYKCKFAQVCSTHIAAQLSYSALTTLKFLVCGCILYREAKLAGVKNFMACGSYTYNIYLYIRVVNVEHRVRQVAQDVYVRMFWFYCGAM